MPSSRGVGAAIRQSSRLGTLWVLAWLAVCAAGALAGAAAPTWALLLALVLVVVSGSAAAVLTHARVREAAERRREAELAVEMARLLLRGGSLEESLPLAGARLAHVIGVSSATIHLAALAGDERHVAMALNDGSRRIGTVLLPVSAGRGAMRRARDRILPSLEALLSAALERDALQGEVVETEALRHADVVKTAVLRAVSHDFRSPLTAISAAGEALALERLSPQSHRELAAVVTQETRRLARLVDNVLDASRLEAGAAQPRLDWTSVEEVLGAAVAELALGEAELDVSIDAGLPLVRVDSAQLERAFVNVLENARRHSGGQPVAVRVRASAGAGAAGGRLVVRIVDRGPGIPAAELERVFEPFYRGSAPGAEHRGSGLGLAIARGFTEANGGTLAVESLPSQGAAFVFELPIESPTEAPPAVPDPREHALT